MDKGIVKVKLSPNALEGMYTALGKIWLCMVSESQLELVDQLLMEHVINMRDEMFMLLARKQEKYTMRMKTAEAMAFYTICQRWKAPINDYEAMLLQELFVGFDKMHKEPRLLR